MRDSARRKGRKALFRPVWRAFASNFGPTWEKVPSSPFVAGRVGVLELGWPRWNGQITQITGGA